MIVSDIYEDVLITPAQIPSTKPKSISAQVQVLLGACQRFAMMRISESGPNWK